MKKTFCFIFSLFAAFVFCSCASFEPTRNLEEALANVEDGIVYYDREYMESKDLTPPNVPDLEKLGVLKFLFAFDQHQSAGNAEVDTNQLTKREFDIFKAEFENAVAGSRRFPAAQIRHGLADKNLRKESRSGGNAAAEFDTSSLVEPDGILHIKPALSVSESLVGREKTVTNTFSMTCSPLDPKNNAPLDDFDPFPTKVEGRVYQLTDRFGRAVSGFRFNTAAQLEDYHLRQGRAAIAKFFVRMYKIFPVGGKIVEIDEDGNASLLASRQNGMLPNMECIIFAVRKGNPQGARIALYNATAISVAQKGSTTLQIWRKSDKKGAKKIIDMIEEDFQAACEEYDFYAASEGFAEWPDFLEKQNTGLE